MSQQVDEGYLIHSESAQFTWDNCSFMWGRQTYSFISMGTWKVYLGHVLKGNILM